MRSEWPVTFLGTLLRPVTTVARDLSVSELAGAPVLSLTKNNGLIPQSERFNHRVARADTSAYKVVRKNWIVYNPYVLWEGAIFTLLDRPLGLVSPVYQVWEVPGSDVGFLDLLLRTPRLLAEYYRLSSGVVQRRRSISPTAFLGIQIPLPPLQEQRTITELVARARASLDTRRRELVLERECKAALLQHLFTYGARGEPTKLTRIGHRPKSWTVQTLSDVARIERGKFSHRPRNDPRFYGGTTPFVQTGDVATSGGRIRSFTQTLNERGLSVSRVFARGTILITIAANIGYTGILDFDSALPDSLIGITPKDCVSNEYLNYYLTTQQPEMDRLAPRGTQKNINIEFLVPWPVPVPRLDEQSEIVAILAACDEKIAILEREIALYDELFRALLEEVMSGRLSIAPLLENEAA